MSLSRGKPIPLSLASGDSTSLSWSFSRKPKKRRGMELALAEDFFKDPPDYTEWCSKVSSKFSPAKSSYYEPRERSATNRTIDSGIWDSTEDLNKNSPQKLEPEREYPEEPLIAVRKKILSHAELYKTEQDAAGQYTIYRGIDVHQIFGVGDRAQAASFLAMHDFFLRGESTLEILTSRIAGLEEVKRIAGPLQLDSEHTDQNRRKISLISAHLNPSDIESVPAHIKLLFLKRDKIEGAQVLALPVLQEAGSLFTEAVHLKLTDMTMDSVKFTVLNSLEFSQYWTFTHNIFMDREPTGHWGSQVGRITSRSEDDVYPLVGEVEKKYSEHSPTRSFEDYLFERGLEEDAL